MTGNIRLTELANRLGLSRRQAQNLVGLGVLLPVEKDRFNPADCAKRYQLFKSRDPASMSDAADEAGDLLAAASRAVARLDAEHFEPEEVARVGSMIEQADGLLRLLVALRPEGERPMADILRGQIVGGLISRLIDHAAEAQAFVRRPAAGRAA